MSIKSLFLINYPRANDVKVVEQKLEVKQSTNPNAGKGLFTTEKILKDTIFLKCEQCNLPDSKKTHISRYINDLAFSNNIDKYDSEENLSSNINIGYIRHFASELSEIGFVIPDIYIYAIKDIEAGEELSKYYGLDYWQKK